MILLMFWVLVISTKWQITTLKFPKQLFLTSLLIFISKLYENCQLGQRSSSRYLFLTSFYPGIFILKNGSADDPSSGKSLTANGILTWRVPSILRFSVTSGEVLSSTVPLPRNLTWTYSSPKSSVLHSSISSYVPVSLWNLLIFHSPGFSRHWCQSKST